MDLWGETMSVLRENKSYCACASPKEKKLICFCGEVEYEPTWKWDENVKTSTTIISHKGQKVYFHKGYSVGNACVRGNTPLVAGYDYYWEVKMLSSVYGTSVMIGIGTENFDINQANEIYCNLLGCDSESWGMKFDGKLYHNEVRHNYNSAAGFTMGSIVGVHLDMWNGTLEFYLNRIPLGIAFRGLKNKVLYPMLSSTASHTIMKLIYAHSEPHSLALLSAKSLGDISIDKLPPGLKSYSKKCWWRLPKSGDLKSERKYDVLPPIYSVDVLSDSDDDGTNQNSPDFSALAHRIKRVFESPPSQHMMVRPNGSSEAQHFHTITYPRPVRRHKYRSWVEY